MENKFDISAFVNALTEEKVTKDLVDRVKERRKELKISQKELSTRTLVSYGSIRRFENSGQISLTSLIRIANALNCLSDFNLLFKTKQITNLKDYKV
ncbi:MAG: helix-turn-helix transcriptional regulator [Candidatus Caccosoma sp.]|nr:helix-turn-helix transcriptional regulator [Candidatus Caccosoma sp.]